MKCYHCKDDSPQWEKDSSGEIFCAGCNAEYRGIETIAKIERLEKENAALKATLANGVKCFVARDELVRAGGESLGVFSKQPYQDGSGFFHCSGSEIWLSKENFSQIKPGQCVAARIVLDL